MLESIWKEKMLMDWTASWSESDLIWQLLATGLVSIPTVIYAAIVWVANQLYRKLANRLTEWGTKFHRWKHSLRIVLTHFLVSCRKSSNGITI